MFLLAVDCLHSGIIPPGQIRLCPLHHPIVELSICHFLSLPSLRILAATERSLKVALLTNVSAVHALILLYVACQTRLGQSIRLQKITVFETPKRCTTPLLPFHEIPGHYSDEDHEIILSAPKQPWDEDSEISISISLSQSPSPTLRTPMSTSNEFDTAGM